LCAEYGVAVRFKRIQEALHIITDRGIYPFDARETYSLADIAAGHVAKRDNSDVRADYDMFMKRGWLRVTEQVGV
jgi:hypothetical protein